MFFAAIVSMPLALMTRGSVLILTERVAWNNRLSHEWMILQLQDYDGTRGFAKEDQQISIEPI